MHDTLTLLDVTVFPALRRGMLTTLQVNIGYRCNQTCQHCHVNAGPTRKEMMDDNTLALIVRLLEQGGIETLDITGGAPELHAGFRPLVLRARRLGVRVMDRCNLTVLFEPGQEDTAQFLADNHVEIVASLPCYSIDNVDAQRGEGVFDKSIRALQTLNALGYGKPDSGLLLHLVYNPQGPSLPPAQDGLKADYQRELFAHFGVVFNDLYALANMPIKRFGSTLISRGQFDEYMQLLRSSHNDANLEHVMCRSLISVDWQGYLYDCDFNQQLGLPTASLQGSRPHLRDLLDKNITGESIRVAGHCYGCTAGSGSSCGGALKDSVMDDIEEIKRPAFGSVS